MQVSHFLFVPLITVLLIGCSPSDHGDNISTLEETLANNNKWPYKLVGSLNIIEAAERGDNPDIPEWVIGILSPIGTQEEILVEFKGNVPKEAGFTMDFEYSDPITLWIGPSINEYYQVAKVE